MTEIEISNLSEEHALLNKGKMDNSPPLNGRATAHTFCLNELWFPVMADVRVLLQTELTYFCNSPRQSINTASAIPDLGKGLQKREVAVGYVPAVLQLHISHGSLGK